MSRNGRRRRPPGGATTGPWAGPRVGPRAGPWVGPRAGRGLPIRSAPSGRGRSGSGTEHRAAVLHPADTKPGAEGGISERRSPGEGAGSVSDPRLQGGGGERGAEPPAVTCGSLLTLFLVDPWREHPAYPARCCTNLEEELLPLVIPGDFATWCKSKPFVFEPRSITVGSTRGF